MAMDMHLIQIGYPLGLRLKNGVAQTNKVTSQYQIKLSRLFFTPDPLSPRALYLVAKVGSQASLPYNNLLNSIFHGVFPEKLREWSSFGGELWPPHGLPRARRFGRGEVQLQLCATLAEMHHTPVRNRACVLPRRTLGARVSVMDLGFSKRKQGLAAAPRATQRTTLFC